MYSRNGRLNGTAHQLHIPNFPHRCWAEIHLAAFERNLKRIQAALPAGVRYVSVVKADAYGHGGGPAKGEGFSAGAGNDQLRQGQ